MTDLFEKLNSHDKFVKVSGTDEILYVVKENPKELFSSAYPVRKGQQKIDPYDVVIGDYVIESWGNFIVPDFLLEEHTTDLHEDLDSLLFPNLSAIVAKQKFEGLTSYFPAHATIEFNNKLYRQTRVDSINSIYRVAIAAAHSRQTLWMGKQFRKVKGVDDLIIYVLPCAELEQETTYFRCFVVRPGNTRKATYELMIDNNHVIIGWRNIVVSEFKLMIFTDPIDTGEFKDVVVDDVELTNLWKTHILCGPSVPLKGKYTDIPYNDKYMTEQYAKQATLRDLANMMIPSSEWFK